MKRAVLSLLLCLSLLASSCVGIGPDGTILSSVNITGQNFTGPQGATGNTGATGPAGTFVEISYNATSLLVSTGTLDAGTVASLNDYGGTSVNISEATTTGIVATVNFSAVTDSPNSIEIYGRYQGGANHYIEVAIWDYTTSTWSLLGIMDTATANEWHSFTIPGPLSVNSGNLTQIRFNHVGTGVNSHDLYLDFVQISNAHSSSFDPALYIKADGTRAFSGNLTNTTNNTYDIGSTTNWWSTLWANVVRAATGIFTTLNASGTTTLSTQVWTGNVTASQYWTFVQSGTNTGIMFQTTGTGANIKYDAKNSLQFLVDGSNYAIYEAGYIDCYNANGIRLRGTNKKLYPLGGNGTLSVSPTVGTQGWLGTLIIPTGNMSGAADNATRDTLAGNVNGAIAVDNGTNPKLWIRVGGGWYSVNLTP